MIVDILFDGPPGAVPGRFVEVENTSNRRRVRSIRRSRRWHEFRMLRVTVETGTAADMRCDFDCDGCRSD